MSDELKARLEHINRAPGAKEFAVQKAHLTRHDIRCLIEALRGASGGGAGELLKHHEDRADAAEAEADRLRAFLSAGSLQMLDSEQAWRRRALAAEAALNSRPTPAAATVGAVDLLPVDETVKYVRHYGSRCRDCADEDGVCPSSGFPCGASEKPIRFAVEAINYGVSRGYLKLTTERQPR